MRSRSSGRSRLGIDEQLLCFRCALGFTSPSDSRARQTPRSVFQDGSVEVPTRARGIAPPRRNIEREHAPAVGGGPSGTSPHPVVPSQRLPSSSSPMAITCAGKCPRRAPSRNRARGPVRLSPLPGNEVLNNRGLCLVPTSNNDVLSSRRRPQDHFPLSAGRKQDDA